MSERVPESVAGHGFAEREHPRDLDERVLRWFARYL